MPKYKILTHQGWAVGGVTVHDHATGKAANVKPGDDGLFDLDRAQARLVAQGHVVRAMDGSGLVAGTKQITMYQPGEVIEEKKLQKVTLESLLAKDPKDLIATAEAMALDLNMEAKKMGKAAKDLTPEEIGGLILSRVDQFDRMREKLAPTGPALSSYKSR